MSLSLDGLFAGKVVRWKLLYYFSFLLFAASTLFIPFNQTISVLLLFFLIGTWSRVPGMIAFFAHPMEVFDVLIIAIAVNIDPMTAGIFGFCGILIPKVFAPQEWFPYVIRHSIARFFAAFCVPFAYSYFGGHFLPVFYVFTIVDWIIYLALGPFVEPGGFAGFISGLTYDVMVIPAEVIYTTMIGPPLNLFIDAILGGGVSFNFSLFSLSGLLLGMIYFSNGIKNYQKDIESGKEGSHFYRKVDYILTEILSLKFLFKDKSKEKINARNLIRNIKEAQNPVKMQRFLFGDKKEMLLNQKALNFILADNVALLRAASFAVYNITREELDKMDNNLKHITDALQRENSFNIKFFQAQEEICRFMPVIEKTGERGIDSDLILKQNSHIKEKIEKMALSDHTEIVSYKRKYLAGKTQIEATEIIVRNKIYSVMSENQIEAYLLEKKKEVKRFIVLK